MKTAAAATILAVLTLSVIAAVSVPTDGTTFSVDGVEYTVVLEGTVSVTGGDVRDLVLDGTVSYGGVDYVVSSVGDYAFSGSESLVSVDVSGVSSIGAWAFNLCMNLETVRLGEGVESIGERAFGYCNVLREVSLSSTVSYMYANPFVSCGSLGTVAVDPGNATYAVIEGSLVDSQRGILVVCVSGTGDYVIPDAVTSVEEAGFYGRTGITSLTIHDGVYRIGDLAFSGMTDLGSVTLPERLDYLGMNAFFGCESLTSVRVPSCLVTGEYVFNRCIGLTEVTLSDSLTYIADGMFYYCSSLQEVVVPDGVTRVGASAFEGCASLRNLSIPAGVEYVGKRALADCPNLMAVDVAEGGAHYMSDDGVLLCLDTMELVKYPAARTDSVYSVPTGIIVIADSAFSGCGLSAVDLPEGLVSIGDEAFAFCGSLRYLELPSTVTLIGDGAFYRCSSLEAISIPRATVSIGGDVFTGCSSLRSIDVDPANSDYVSMDGVLYTSDMTVLKQFPGGKSQRVYVLPATVTELGAGALALCTGLMAIDVEQGSTAFSSTGGVLMDATGTTVIVVPSGMVGEYRVPEEVVRFETGALRGCYDVSLIFYTTDVEFEIESLSVGDQGRSAVLEISAPPGFEIQEFASDDYTRIVLDTGGEARDMATIVIGIAVSLFAVISTVALLWRRP